MYSNNGREQKIYENIDPSLEKARNQEIKGYVHPTNVNNCNRDARYKTFDDGNNKKIKKMNKVKGVNSGPAYVAYGEPPNDLPEFLCPTCPEKSPAVVTCPCVNNDMRCVQGHVWYIDRSGNVRVGDPHKKG